MTIQTLIEIYVTLALGGLLALWIFSEMRRRRFGPTHTEDRVFRFRCTRTWKMRLNVPIESIPTIADVDRSRCIAMRQIERAD
jgi:hypothetical protein